MLNRRLCIRGSLVCAAAAAAIAVAGAAVAQDRAFEVNRYRVMSLVTDRPIAAPTYKDENLVNAWGLARSENGPWWVANNGTDTSTVYAGNGRPEPLVVLVSGAPTGTVYHEGNGFVVNMPNCTPAPAEFIFASEDGTISAWNANTKLADGSPAAGVVIDRSGEDAIYKGIAIAETAAGDRLLATDFHNGRVDVFDEKFALMDTPDAFVDDALPKGYAPFGIRALDGMVFVTYAKQDDDAEDDVAGVGKGFVDAFDSTGALLARVASRGRLDAPWGLAMAPSTFGRFSGDLLVGQFGSGEILAFDPDTYEMHGVLRNERGNPISIDGLWAIDFGNGGLAGARNLLYFTAGPGDESHGRFGTILPPNIMQLSTPSTGTLVGR